MHPQRQAQLVVNGQRKLVVDLLGNPYTRAVLADQRFELRQLRTFLTVVERRSFTQAGEELHVAQQAVSQQIRALERALEVTLLERSSRKVDLTPAGAVFAADCRRVLAAADRAQRRVKIAAKGEAGTLNVAYTLTTAWDTIPALQSYLAEQLPDIKLAAREVFGEDIEQLLTSGRHELALAPMTTYPRDLDHQPIRREHFRVAVGAKHELSGRRGIELSELSEERFEIWPREMAPGFYDAVVGACRAAGFEPQLDERAAGNTVWGDIARGRGIALINRSLAESLPRGVELIELANPKPVLTIEAVWRRHDRPAIVERAVQAAIQLGLERSWL